MMEVLINDEKREVHPRLNLTELIKEEGLHAGPFAVALNGEFVPKAKHEETVLRDGDKIEIVSPREGG